MDAQRHWENIYGKKAADAVSWYRPHLETSLELISRRRLNSLRRSSTSAVANPLSSTICLLADTRTSVSLIFRRLPSM